MMLYIRTSFMKVSQRVPGLLSGHETIKDRHTDGQKCDYYRASAGS